MTIRRLRLSMLVVAASLVVESLAFGASPLVAQPSGPIKPIREKDPPDPVGRVKPPPPGVTGRPAGSPPGGVRITSVSPVSATLSWTAAPGASSYTVTRYTIAPLTGLRGNVTVTEAPVTTTSIVDRGLAPNTTYYWNVSANYPSLSPGSSPAVSAMTSALRNPTGFTAVGTKVGEILLNWNAQEDVAYYRLEVCAPGRSACRDGPPLLDWGPQDSYPSPRPITSASYTAKGLSPGLHQFSLVTYFNSVGGQTIADQANPSETRGAVLAKNSQAWLSKPNGVGSLAETQSYYTTIGALPAKNTFAKWKVANGFPAQGRAVDEVRARYFNAQDLNLGRDTHCRVNAGRLACYQSNSGPSPASSDFPNSTAALADIVRGAPPFATVAMDVDAGGKVNFYAFNNATDSIVLAADLDTEGKKAIPNACTGCHGGRYNLATHTLTNASFLPFDVFGFQFASVPGLLLIDQQEAFRKLNSLVKGSRPNLVNPHNPIATFIDGVYGGNVDVPGATANDNWVPPGWSTKPDAYHVFKRTCRTCHLAVADPSMDFIAYQQLTDLKARAKIDICGLVMPHAEVPYRKFWLSTNVYLPGYWADPAVFGIGCP